MWCKLPKRVSEEHVDALVTRIMKDESTQRNDGLFNKTFFSDNTPTQSNLDLLKLIHSDVWPQLSYGSTFELPVIDHATLLIKKRNSVEIGLHQDRVYWVNKEQTATLFSVWIALEDMTYEKGGIMLSEGTRTEIIDMNRFNMGLLHEHIDVKTAPGGFPLVIANPLASRLKQSIRCIELKKGEAIAFDSFEPHMSGKNIHSSPRLAMKITYCEGKKRTKYLIKIGQLKD
jgi:hypothetical protein